MASVTDRIFTLIKDAVEAQNVTLWDVRFLKEGASYYLRVFIDKEDGIDINDCTAVSHAIDPIIDEADPISQSYYLEVCSPGLERSLTRPEHFERFIGADIIVKLYKAYGGSKELKGKLIKYDGGVEIETPSEHIYFTQKDIVSVKLDDLNN